MARLEEEMKIRKNMYNFLGKSFYYEPKKEQLERFLSINIFENSDNFTFNDEIKEAALILNKFWFNNQGKKVELVLQELKEEYYRLFIGPNKLIAPPYSSVYLGKEQVIFELETLQIRDCYRAWEVEVEKKGKEPDDHIGLELLFMEYLIKKYREFFKNQQKDLYWQCLMDQSYFLNQFILSWSEQFFKLIFEGTDEGYYKGLAFLAEGFLKEDSIYLKNLLKYFLKEAY